MIREGHNGKKKEAERKGLIKGKDRDGNVTGRRKCGKMERKQ